MLLCLFVGIFVPLSCLEGFHQHLEIFGCMQLTGET